MEHHLTLRWGLVCVLFSVHSTFGQLAERARSGQHYRQPYHRQPYHRPYYHRRPYPHNPYYYPHKYYNPYHPYPGVPVVRYEPNGTRNGSVVPGYGYWVPGHHGDVVYPTPVPREKKPSFFEGVADFINQVSMSGASQSSQSTSMDNENTQQALTATLVLAGLSTASDTLPTTDNQLTDTEHHLLQHD